MTIKLIKTGDDYTRVLARVDELMDAKAGSSEGDELELLVRLIELQEERRCTPSISPIQW